MKKKDIKKIVLLLSVIFVISAAIPLYFFRMDIYKLLAANVETDSIGPMFINGEKYDTVLPNSCVYEGENGGAYVFLAKKRSTFWYESNYCYIAKINIIAKNDTHSAVIFQSGYTSGDEIITSSNDRLKHGQDIYCMFPN